MQVEIPCEKCRVALRVPPEAAGHRARCPACGHTFVVPRVEQLLEDTVSNWIEEDLETLVEDRDRALEQRADVAAVGAEGDSATATASPPAEGPPPRPQPQPQPQGRDGQADRGSRREDRRLWPMRSAPHGQPDPIDSGDPDIEIITEPVRPRRPSKAPEPKPVAVSEQADDHSDKKGKYPRNLHVDQRVPHLVVQKVDAAGVHFAFDSEWLKHDGFRASMPVRCAFSGATARDKLIARPLVFMDKALSSGAVLEQIVGAHENRTISDHSPREVARSMGIIEGLPRPFAYAMPYYVAAKVSHLSIHCRTRDRVSGGITCEVLVPDAACALDWLARVNGVCGEEYHLLEQDVSLLHGDAWQSLSEEARKRIEVWCRFQPREVLRHYFSDADFGRRDEGLAGLIVTDQRLVFCKYHHKGQLRIDAEDATILAKPEGRFVSLTLRTGSDLQRMVKLHQTDLDRLADGLKSHGSVGLQLVD